MTVTVFDTGPLLAAFNANDKHHARCVDFLKGLKGRRLLPGTVLAEVCWSLERWPNIEASFIDQVVKGRLELVQLTHDDLRRISELVVKYGDFPLGAVDASVIAIAERYETERIATIDHRHFTVVKPKHVSALTLLP
ncbi:PIN domain-containing protein [Streptomyces sp. A3M-1-3]|uniref:type II toxin-antitoxin system VapC family toxin n=1 Tax=Streptomyces sp. A3M-1-3 TaxID=2962044 RepID=UPI0020B90042|nr:PIN domain-containing protein [Streptomyces sp. A3M-1-3]MCP3819035.1 PIN domain-containing protein [Streptomyces sp. A3M-1-3]